MTRFSRDEGDEAKALALGELCGRLDQFDSWAQLLAAEPDALVRQGLHHLIGMAGSEPPTADDWVALAQLALAGLTIAREREYRAVLRLGSAEEHAERRVIVPAKLHGILEELAGLAQSYPYTAPEQRAGRNAEFKRLVGDALFEIRQASE